MQTVTINTCKFSELSEQAKKKAIEKFYDININHNWWECTYYDAKTIGLKITSFDLDRHKECNGKLTLSMSECCRLIMANHGEICETSVTAATYFNRYNELVEKYSDGINTDIVADGNEYDFDQEADELEADFLKAILEDYANILQNECDYLTSKEAIIETIEANEYDFTEEGKLW